MSEGKKIRVEVPMCGAGVARGSLGWASTRAFGLQTAALVIQVSMVMLCSCSKGSGVNVGDGSVDRVAIDNVRPPTPISLAPADVEVGQSVTISGSDFLPNPRVRLDDAQVSATAMTATQITFVVPSGLALPACAAVVNVTVQNDVGTGGPLSLRVRRPAPHVDLGAGATVRAGEVLTVSGAWLTGAVATLDGAELQKQSGSDSALAVVIPRQTTTGAHSLSVSACGATSVSLSVQVPSPQITKVDLESVAASGVVLVTADVSFGASIDGVQLGSRQISLADPASFQWRSQGAQQSVFALRVPQDVTMGPVNLLIGGSGAQSVGHTLAVISASKRAPAAASGIVFPPVAAVDDPFPTSSREPFPQQDLQAPPPSSTEASWVYTLEMADAGQNGTCTHRGNISGTEKHCPANTFSNGVPCPITNVHCPAGVCSACDGDVCNSIAGTYQLDKADNQVSVTIDRLDPAGPEPYVGGWTRSNGTAPLSTSEGDEFLALRSLRTGMILTIHHSFDPPSLQHCQ